MSEPCSPRARGHASTSRRRARLLALAVALAATTVGGFAPAAPAAITQFPLPAADSAPFAITAGPDGALWFTELGNGLGAGNARIGRITTAGAITELPVPTSSAFLFDITRGPDGALWFTEGFT